MASTARVAEGAIEAIRFEIREELVTGVVSWIKSAASNQFDPAAETGIGMTTTLTIPTALLPGDGRFGCGPSKVRPDALRALAEVGADLMGTSHRQLPVLFEVSKLRNGIAELFALPDGYEVLLGNGGSTLFWDMATFGLIESASAHAVFGEFSSKFYAASHAAPHLGGATKFEAPAGSCASLAAVEGADVYALTHNETSTGVMSPLLRPEGISDSDLVVVDATSAAGGLPVKLADVDVYYFAPQKCFASDGGLFVAIVSPRAIERIERIQASSRWTPAILDLGIVLENSRKDQTYNTPALATVFMMNQQIDWMREQGGLAFTTARCAQSAATIYSWAEASAYATPYVHNAALRSHVVATIDFDDNIDAAALAATLRANGIVDTEPYRKLGRNQLRVALFPAIDPADVQALTGCIDYVIANQS